MGNLFDRLADKTFGVVSRVQGEIARWTPTNSNVEQSARILYKDPTAVSKILQLEYNPNNYALEYMQGSFTGLKELADQNNQNLERITIAFDSGDVEYQVIQVHTIVDGRNYLALLEKV